MSVEIAAVVSMNSYVSNNGQTLSKKDYHREEHRLESFEKWPHSWLDKHRLALTGMRFIGKDDTVECVFCNVQIGKWQREDDPVSEHQQASANLCPLLRGSATKNVCINAEELDRILPQPNYDVVENLHMDAICFNSPMRTIEMTNYSREDYSIETARLRSFDTWPLSSPQKQEQLAEAGFFYLGCSDCVKCHSCGGCLNAWKAQDDPWEEHAKWFSDCMFVILRKGRTYITAVKEEDLLATLQAPEEATAGDVSKLKVLESNSGNVAEDILCKICYDDVCNMAFQPCGHVACAKCATSVTKCPICRQPFEKLMRIYLS